MASFHRSDDGGWGGRLALAERRGDVSGHRPLRFCMVTTFYPPYHLGGDGVFVHRLANELAGRGHQVTVVHSVDAYQLLSDQRPVEAYDNHPNVTVHGLRSRLGPLVPLAAHQLGAPALMEKSLRRVMDAPFDVIHYHNISLMGGPRVLELGRGIKLMTLHEYWLVCPTHVMFKFGREACREPRCLACSLAYRRPPQLWRHSGALASSLKHVDALIAASRFVVDLHRERGLDVPFVSIPHFAPAVDPVPSCDPPSAEERPFFLCAGRLEKLKGFQTVIPLFREYDRAELRIAGAGSYEPALRAMAGNSPNVRFLGRLTQEELQTLYARAVALVVPSLCFEIFPQVIIEAFRQRTPVIVRNLGSMPEPVAASGGGLVYDQDGDLSGALDALLADPERRRRMGAAGYEAYQRTWSPDAHIERYLGLIDDLASQRARSS